MLSNSNILYNKIYLNTHLIFTKLKLLILFIFVHKSNIDSCICKKIIKNSKYISTVAKWDENITGTRLILSIQNLENNQEFFFLTNNLKKIVNIIYTMKLSLLFQYSYIIGKTQNLLFWILIIFWCICLH